MTVNAECDYKRPALLGDALKLAASNHSSTYLAGGTDLIMSIDQGGVNPLLIIDLKEIEELHKISLKPDFLEIGALATITEVLESSLIRDKFPVFWEACHFFASVSIRNRATIGGNICNAVPCADCAPPFLVYEGKARVAGPDGEREVDLSDFFRGNRQTVLTEREILTKVLLPEKKQKNAGAFLKLKRYRGEDLAQGSVAVLMDESNQYRVAFGSLAAKPLRGYRIEKLLEGKSITPELIEEAKNLVPDEISPITDIRSSREYRILMAQVMLERGIKASVERLNGNGPEYGSYLI